MGSDAGRLLADKSPEELEKIMNAFSGLDISESDLDSFDYTTVAVKKGSFWVMQLTRDGFVDRGGNFAAEYKAGCRPNFQLMICAISRLTVEELT